MYKVSVNQNPEIEINVKNGKYFVNDLPADFDIVTNADGSYHALYEGKSYNIKVRDIKGDILTVDINNKITHTRIKNELEDRLTKMGMDKLSGSAMNELKAPMPGMVLKIIVKEGDQVKKGDSLLVLEAMKMENILKAPGDGVVSAIKVTLRDNVTKGQVLIQFS